MKKIFNTRNIIITSLIILVIIQFFRIDSNNPPVEIEKDLITITQADAEIKSILKTSCYDCHSNETKYPWYASIAPISWLIKNHVVEGKKHLNFSIWGTYNEKKANHKLEECVSEVQEGEMPMKQYTIIHSEATLSESQKTKLIAFFKSLQK